MTFQYFNELKRQVLDNIFIFNESEKGLKRTLLIVISQRVPFS